MDDNTSVDETGFVVAIVVVVGLLRVTVTGAGVVEVVVGFLVVCLEVEVTGFVGFE